MNKEKEISSSESLNGRSLRQFYVDICKEDQVCVNSSFKKMVLIYFDKFFLNLKK
jgi:hypothetical protein